MMAQLGTDGCTGRAAATSPSHIDEADDHLDDLDWGRQKHIVPTRKFDLLGVRARAGEGAQTRWRLASSSRNGVPPN